METIDSGCSTTAVFTLGVGKTWVQFPAARLNEVRKGDCPAKLYAK